MQKCGAKVLLFLHPPKYLYYLCTIFCNFLGSMKHFTRHSGILLVVLGAILLFVGVLAHWTYSNAFSLFCLLLIIAGVVLYVVDTKHGSNY